MFVGIVDDDYSLIQYETKLFILNHSILAEEYFYQTVVFNFNYFYKLEIPSAEDQGFDFDRLGYG